MTPWVWCIVINISEVFSLSSGKRGTLFTLLPPLNSDTPHSSKTLVMTYSTVWCHIPEDSNLHTVSTMQTSNLTLFYMMHYMAVKTCLSPCKMDTDRGWLRTKYWGEHLDLKKRKKHSMWEQGLEFITKDRDKLQGFVKIVIKYI